MPTLKEEMDKFIGINIPDIPEIQTMPLIEGVSEQYAKPSKEEMDKFIQETISGKTQMEKVFEPLLTFPERVKANPVPELAMGYMWGPGAEISQKGFNALAVAGISPLTEKVGIEHASAVATGEMTVKEALASLTGTVVPYSMKMDIWKRQKQIAAMDPNTAEWEKHFDIQRRSMTPVAVEDATKPTLIGHLGELVSKEALPTAINIASIVGAGGASPLTLSAGAGIPGPMALVGKGISKLPLLKLPLSPTISMTVKSPWMERAIERATIKQTAQTLMSAQTQKVVATAIAAKTAKKIAEVTRQGKLRQAYQKAISIYTYPKELKPTFVDLTPVEKTVATNEVKLDIIRQELKKAKSKHVKDALLTERLHTERVLQSFQSDMLKEIAPAVGITPARMDAMSDFIFWKRRLSIATGGKATSDFVKGELTNTQMNELKEKAIPITKILSGTDIGLTGASAKFWDKNLALTFSRATELSSELINYFRPAGRVMQGNNITKSIYNGAAIADGAGENWLAREANILIKNVPFKPGSESSLKVGKLLDNYNRLLDIPKHIRLEMTPQEIDAFNFFRSKYDYLAELYNIKNPGKLAKGDRISNYIFRGSNRTEKLAAYTQEKSEVMGFIERGINVAENKQLLNKINQSIEIIKSGDIKKIPPYVSKYVAAPQLKHRTAVEGPAEIDAVSSYMKYLALTRRYIYDEPAIQYGLWISKRITDPQMKAYSYNYLRRFYGEGQGTGRLDQLGRVITSLEYIHALGGNTRSAVVNVSQNFNLIPEIGLKDMSVGAYKMTIGGDVFLDNIWSNSIHKRHFQAGIEYMTAKIGRNIVDSTMILMNKTEIANRKLAVYSMANKVRRLGSKMPEVKVLLDKGFTLTEAAQQLSDAVASKAHFVYGRIGASMAMTTSLGRPVFQFTSYPLNQSELFIDWAKNNPERLLSYMIMVNGTKWNMQELGYDVSNFLGMGVDIGLVNKALADLLAPEGKKFQATLKAAAAIDPVITGGGVLPTGFMPVISTLKSAYNYGWITLLPIQVQRFYQFGKATQEGIDPLKTGEEKFRLSSLPTDGAKVYLDIWQMINRTVGPRPMAEREEVVTKRISAIEERLERRFTRETTKAFMDKDYNKFAKNVISMAKIGKEYDEKNIEEAFKKKWFTPTMLQVMNKTRQTVSIDINLGKDPSQSLKDVFPILLNLMKEKETK